MVALSFFADGMFSNFSAAATTCVLKFLPDAIAGRAD